MKYTVDQTHIRSINQRVILEKIYRDEPVSRAELARELCISKSAMTENVTALLNKGIIQEVGAGVSMAAGGRKPILLKFHSTYRYIIAIELNFEDAIFVIANLKGEILNRFTVNIPNDSTYYIRLDSLKDSINFLLSANNIKNSDLAIIGISCPGIYDSVNRAYFADSNFASWNMGELSKELEILFETHVLVVNDVNAAAVGEFTYGAGKKSRNMVYISAGLGLGAGIIINGSLYTGSNNCAGEISKSVGSSINIKHLDSSKNFGDMVKIASLLLRIRNEAPKKTVDAFAALGKNLEKITFKDTAEVWKKDDLFLKKCVSDISEIMGIVISDIVNLLNCDMVIIGGEYAEFASQILPAVNNIINENTFVPIEAVSSQLGRDSGIYGLFALSRDIIFNDISEGKSHAV